ncbi:hypothetical protein HJFPF1_06682 [Paramyrothecium foliicola]|nr:hypothetical protein HJFPF1_06682 [Paramyrothecium foliicola]
MSAPPEPEIVDTVSGNGEPQCPTQAFSTTIPNSSHSEVQQENSASATSSPKRKTPHDDDGGEEADDERTRRKIRKKEKKKKKERRAKRKADREARRRARTERGEAERRRQHNHSVENDLESPIPSDYTRRFGALNPNHYPMRPVRIEPPRPHTNRCAFMPSVPDAMDDRPLERDSVEAPSDDSSEVEVLPTPRVRPPARSRVRSRVPYRARSTTPPLPARPVLPRPPDLLWCHEFPVKKMKPFFTHMPAEVRYLVYKELLVTEKNIVVYGKWTRIFPRHKPGLGINILLTCREIYEEAVPVLYGENTFLYRLRDPPGVFAELFDVSQLPHVDEAGGLFETTDNSDEFDEFDEFDGTTTGAEEGANLGVADVGESEPEGNDTADESNSSEEGGDDENLSDEDYNDEAEEDDGSEYEEEQAHTSRARRSRVPAPDILIDKFKPMIRHIAVQAESNRCSTSFKNMMAQAIRVFAAPAIQSNPMYRNQGIKSLTIRVAPTPNAGHDDGWTFLDFFEYTSPVMGAAAAVQPDFFRVELTETGKSGISLTGNMWSYSEMLRLAAHRKDPWAGDLTQQLGRKMRARRCNVGLGELRAKVLSCCRRWQTASDAETDESEKDEPRPNEFWSSGEWNEYGTTVVSEGLAL